MFACTRLAALVALGILVVSAHTARAQAVDGAQVFQRSCASCHASVAPDSRAPNLDALRARTPQAVVESLMTGTMRVQGARMSGAERRAVAEFVTGKAIGGDVTGAATGRCAAGSRPAPANAQARWGGWSSTLTNTRFQSSEQAGLAVGDLKRLTLKWAFGFPDASVAWSQPAVAGGRVFVGSQNGTVYALDAKTGCVYWTFSAPAGVRTGIAVGPAGAGSSVYFGDTSANAYALDAETGKTLWVRKVDDHPSARVTGSPALHDGRLYVPVASYEEAQGANPEYGCCTFRGSLVALDATTGAVQWKTYMIPDEPKPRGTSTAGVTLWGPSGAGIWSAPTVDVRRRAIYVATGNAYSAPAAPTSDAVVALDLDTGRIRWVRQATAGDVYVSGCRPGNPNCPETAGPDFDFGSPPMLATVAGREIIIIGQKSGIGFAMDPDKDGALIWQYRAGRGGVLGGIEWGSAVDGDHAYFAVSDITLPQPGGLHAVRLATGERVWHAAPPPLKCAAGRGCSGAQSSAVTAIPGAVFSGSVDGALRAFSTTDGSMVWEFDTNREFTPVNAVPARGASMIGPGPAIAGGMVFVNSGYGAFLGRAGNVLLAFGLD
jgi:polyvinyl alcohol dehydrogenase (cytochrome)